MKDIHSEEVPSNSTLIPKITRVLAGDDKPKAQWVSENLTSINETVQQGRHDTLWYPASGVDILRVACAYDATDAVGIDDEETIKQLKSRLEAGDIEYTVESDTNERFTVKLQDGNKTRLISVINGDARLISPQDFGLDQIDVLHIYLPTGATSQIEEVDPETGETVKRGIPVVSQISSHSLSLVKEGGFLCFGEKGLGPEPIPDSLLKILGLKKHVITNRHPHTVSTSFYPSGDELASISRDGVIYQKVSTVPSELGDLGLNTLMTVFWQTYPLSEFNRGRVEFLGLNEETVTPDRISQLVTEWRVSRNEALSDLEKVNVDPLLLVELEQEMERIVMGELKRIQANMRDFLSDFAQISELYRSKEISGNEALARLGVQEVKSGGYKSDKYPIAPVVAMGLDNADLVEKIVTEFVKLDLDKF